MKKKSFNVRIVQIGDHYQIDWAWTLRKKGQSFIWGDAAKTDLQKLKDLVERY
jgi:hypothetical protein